MTYKALRRNSPGMTAPQHAPAHDSTRGVSINTRVNASSSKVVLPLPWGAPAFAGGKVRKSGGASRNDKRSSARAGGWSRCAVWEHTGDERARGVENLVQHLRLDSVEVLEVGEHGLQRAWQLGDRATRGYAG